MRCQAVTVFASLAPLLLVQWAEARPSPVTVAPDRVLEDRQSGPTVTLASGTVIGSSTGGVDSFIGIPFAQPPVGPLRLKPPQPLNSSFGTLQATGTAPSCPQMLISTGGNNVLTQELAELSNTPLFQNITDASEDCLNLNVFRPTGTTAGAGLPVLFWIFGGGFEFGGTSIYNPTLLINNAISRGQPFIFVAVNYRLGGFGFMPGKEILADGSANLGLLDQRLGLEWNADNIAAFGGDPTKVTIWGESAGSISVFDQLALYGGKNTYKGKPLFRGAIMDSGSIVPTDPVDCPKGQAVYDAVVAAGGCSSAPDTLECLRGLSYEAFLNAANSVPGIISYQSLALSYLPRPDGTALPLSPEVLVQNGQYAAVPMIIGDQEDEGTIFSLNQSNVTTTDLLVQYLATYYYQDATTAQIQALVATYPTEPADGSPFRTGDLNELYPQYKRIAALLGDTSFTLNRRIFLATAAKVRPTVPSWSYLASYDYGTPDIGTFHASDLLQVFFGVLPDNASAAIQAYYFNFLYNLDPNNYAGNSVTLLGSLVKFANWPQWSQGQNLLQFSSIGSNLLADNFRGASYAYLSANLASFRI